MTQGLAQILQDVDRLSVDEQAELADHLAQKLEGGIPEELKRLHLQVVRRRVEEVESGAVALIPGKQALAKVRKTLRAKA